MPSIEVQVANAAWPGEPDDPESITRRVVGALTAELGPDVLSGAITYRFTSDEEVRELNAQFREKDKPTNVLSFPATPMPAGEGDEVYLGDVVLALETVTAEATAQYKTVADHTAHLVAHGTLHLLGHDHQSEEDAEKMETIERNVLARMGVSDPYAEEVTMGAAHGA